MSDIVFKADKYMQHDIEEAITNYISYVEKQENSNSRYNREKIRNGYKALKNRDLQLEYLLDGFNSMLNSLELDERFGEQYRADTEYYKEKYEKMHTENWHIKREYKVPDFGLVIKEHIEFLEQKQCLNKYQLKSLERCKSALDNVVKQEECVKYIIRDLNIENKELKNKLKDEVI